MSSVQLGGGNFLKAQNWTDVTSQYIENADLVSSKYTTANSTYWPVYTTGRKTSAHPQKWYLHTWKTYNNQFGSNYFEVWQNGMQAGLFQDVTLPAGKYQFEGRFSTNQSAGKIVSLVITPHHTYTSDGITASNWGSFGAQTTDFTLYEETKVRVGAYATMFMQINGFTLRTLSTMEFLQNEITNAPTALSTQIAEAQAVLDDAEANDDARRTATKTLHDAVVAYNIENATEDSPIDMTDYIVNPSFEAIADGTLTGEKHSAPGWTYDTPNDQGARAVTSDAYRVTNGDGFYLFNIWGGSSMTVKQTISGLPSGKYKLSGKYASDANKSATLYIGTSQKIMNSSSEGKTVFVDGETDIYTLPSGTNVEIGITSTGWFKADDFRLTYLGIDLTALQEQLTSLKNEAEDLLEDEDYKNVIGKEKANIQSVNSLTANTASEYTIAISTAQEYIDAFTAAQSYYDALVVEIAKAKALGIDAATADGYAATSETTAATALTNTQNLKVEEYNYVTGTYKYGVKLGEWTSTGTNTSAAKFSNEHWSGTTHDYMNQNDNNGQGWNANSWSIDFNQNLTLPAGNYVFKVAGRQASGDQVNTSLIVRQGETVLGEVSDFPRSNSSRGINKNGATSFDENDAAGFANDGKGFGWEWRYVKFTLTEGATVNIAINSVATAKYQWVSFGDYTVQTDNDANISLIAYNIALNDAQTAKANTDYANVTGEELTALNAAIALDETLDKTNKSAIEAATTTLKETTTAFTAAKDSYDKLVVAKAQFNDADYTQELYPYATDEKFAAIATANAMEEGNATKNAAKATAMIAAYRTFVESNAKAEKSATAVDKTSVVENADAQQGDENAITVGQAFGWTKSTGIERKNNEEFIDATGSGGSNYFNYWNGSNAWTKKITQKVNIPAGKYILTATTRASSTLTKFNLIAGDASAEMKRINADVNTGTFNRGWNDNYVVFTVEKAGQVEIGIDAAGPSNTWMSFDRFRLVQISQEITTTSSANLDGYKTFYNADVNYEVDENTTIYVAEAPSAGATYVKINAVGGKIVPKNTPVILKTSDTENYTITLTPTEETATISVNALQVASAAGAVENAYILGYLDQEGEGLGFYRYEPSLDKGDIYLVVPATTTANVRLGIIADGEATGIESVNDEAGKANDAIYNMAGQRVGNGYKGIVIKNGKKILVK